MTMRTTARLFSVALLSLGLITGCASTTPIEVHTNLLLTAVNIQDQTRCDYGNDGSTMFLMFVEMCLIIG